MNDALDPNIIDPDAAQSVDRSAAVMVRAALLQHDLRNILTPALLSADMLLKNADPVIARQAEIVIDAITRVVNRVE